MDTPNVGPNLDPSPSPNPLGGLPWRKGDRGTCWLLVSSSISGVSTATQCPPSAVRETTSMCLCVGVGMRVRMRVRLKVGVQS